MFLEKSRNAEVVCNQVNNSRFGMQVAGDCQTGKEKIRSNIFYNHLIGLSTVPAVLGAGTGNLGDNIGISGQQDNNNVFNGQYSNPDGFRTFRVYTPGAPVLNQMIHTSLTYDNGSNITNPQNAGAYDLVLAPNSQTCQSLSGCGSQWEQVSPPDLDPSWALDIAADSIFYYAYPEVSAWVDKYILYSDLQRDSVLLASNAILASFYQTQQYQAIGVVRAAEQKVALLSDSTSMDDTLLFMQRLQDAKAAVSAMPDTTNYLYLDKWVTSLCLHIIEFGRDSMDFETRDSLAWLANSCPAVEGLGVYKARVLQAYYTPMQNYSDYALCNASNKGGNGLFDDVIKYFYSGTSNSQQPPALLGNLQGNLVVFPNPTRSNTQFQLHEPPQNGIAFTLSDISGREMFKTLYPAGTQHFQIDISGLPAGLYFYSVDTGLEKYFGKIEKQ